MTQAQGCWSYRLFWMLEALSYSEGSMDSECYVMIVDTTSEDIRVGRTPHEDGDLEDAGWANQDSRFEPST